MNISGQLKEMSASVPQDVLTFRKRSGKGPHHRRNPPHFLLPEDEMVVIRHQNKHDNGNVVPICILEHPSEEEEVVGFVKEDTFFVISAIIDVIEFPVCQWLRAIHVVPCSGSIWRRGSIRRFPSPRKFCEEGNLLPHPVIPRA